MRIKKENKQSKIKLFGKKGEGYVDTGVKILIAVVLGALVLSSLYALFNTTVMPAVKTKVESMFEYSQNGNSGFAESGKEYTIGFHQNVMSDGYANFNVLDANSDDLDSVQVDDLTVPNEQYRLTESTGGLVITLKPECTSELSSGLHNITFVFCDGFAKSTFSK